MGIKLKNNKLNKQDNVFIEIGEYVIPKNSIQYIKKKQSYYTIDYTTGERTRTTYTLYYGEPVVAFNKNADVYNNHGADGAYESNYNYIELTEIQYKRLMNDIASQIIVI